MRKNHWLRWSLLGILLAVSIGWARTCSGPQLAETGIYTLHRTYTGPRAEVWAARFAPGDTLFAAACVDSSVYIWNRNSAGMRVLRQPSGVTNLAFSADGRWLATAAYDGALRLWHWPEGRLAATWPGNGRTAWTLQFSPDSRLLANGNEDGSITLRNLADGSVRGVWRGHTRNVWDPAFSPDGRTLASGSFDAALCIWNVADGRLLRRLEAHGEAIVALAWSPDGRELATTSDDKRVFIWNTAGWTVRDTLPTPEHQQGVQFGPDGRSLITSGRDKDALGELLQNFFGDETRNKGVSMRLWNRTDGSLLQTFSAHANDVNDVQFSRDGQWILSAGADKRVMLWRRR